MKKEATFRTTTFQKFLAIVVTLAMVLGFSNVEAFAEGVDNANPSDNTQTTHIYKKDATSDLAYGEAAGSADGTSALGADASAAVVPDTDDDAASIENAVTVTFVANGESSETKIVAGDVVKKPADPTLEGHIFAAWFAKEGDTYANAPFDFSAHVFEDTTLVALFVEAPGAESENEGDEPDGDADGEPAEGEPAESDVDGEAADAGNAADVDALAADTPEESAPQLFMTMGLTPEKQVTSTVYVYVRLNAEPGVDISGWTLNSNGWYTIGRIDVAGLPEAQGTNSYADNAEYLPLVAGAVNSQLSNGTFDRFFKNAGIDFNHRDIAWTGLKAQSGGAADYVYGNVSTWHLDGQLTLRNSEHALNVNYRFLNGEAPSGFPGNTSVKIKTGESSWISIPEAEGYKIDHVVVNSNGSNTTGLIAENAAGEKGLYVTCTGRDIVVNVYYSTVKLEHPFYVVNYYKDGIQDTERSFVVTDESSTGSTIQVHATQINATNLYGPGYTCTNIGMNGTLHSYAELTAEVSSGSSIDVYYTANAYTVTFKVDGEVYEVKTQAFGSKVELPATPAIEGHSVSAWSVAPGFAVPGFDANAGFEMPARDVEIVATATVNRHTVTFRAPATDTQAPQQEVHADVAWGSEVPQAPGFEAEGYTLAGWTPAYIATAKVTGDMTYIAQWEKRNDLSYTVNLMDVQTGQLLESPVEAGTGAELSSSVIVGGQEFGALVNPTSLVKDVAGYTFKHSVPTAPLVIGTDEAANVINLFYEANPAEEEEGSGTDGEGSSEPLGTPDGEGDGSADEGDSDGAGTSGAGNGAEGDNGAGAGDGTGAGEAADAMDAPVFTPAAVDAPGDAAAPAAAGTDADATASAPAAEAIDDDANPLAAADEEAIDDETPLSAFDELVCWVHYLIMVGIIVTVTYAAIVIARRLRIINEIERYEG